MLKRSSNPGLGRKFYFFGKFKSLILARRSEREHPKSFILQRGGFYYVLEPKAKTNPRHHKQKVEVRLGASGQAYLFDSDTNKKLAGPLPLKEISQITGSIERQRRKRGYRNPSHGTVIYGRVLKIFAQKTSGPYKGQRFVHTFKRGAIMIGKPDGSLVIKHS